MWPESWRLRPGLFDDGQSRGRMVQENAGLSSIDAQAVEEGLHANDVSGILIEDAGDAHAVDVDGFVGQHADACARDGFKVMRSDGKFLVVAR